MVDRYGYPAVFLTILVEGVGIPAPGQTILIAAALSAAHGHLSIVWVMILACLGAGLGNSLGYLLGRWGGRALLARFKVRGDRLARLEELFRRYGGGVVLVARFLDGLRQLNGLVAGMLAMPWRVFTGFNLLGAVLWTGVWGLGTYWLDKDISMVHRIFAQIGPVHRGFNPGGVGGVDGLSALPPLYSKGELSRQVAAPGSRPTSRRPSAASGRA